MAAGENAEITRAKMEPAVPTDSSADSVRRDPLPKSEYKFTLKHPDQLQEYDVILTDFTGALTREGKNHPDNEKFLCLLQQVVADGAKPVVRMFSGGFDKGMPHYGIDLTPYPSLDGIVTLHNAREMSVIRSTIDEVRKRLDKAILVVHDDPGVLAFFQKMAQRRNVKVIATSPQCAQTIYQAESGNIGAIITGSAGISSIDEIKQSNPSLPVIGYSSDADFGARIEKLPGKNNDFVCNDNNNSIGSAIELAKEKMQQQSAGASASGASPFASGKRTWSEGGKDTPLDPPGSVKF